MYFSGFCLKNEKDVFSQYLVESDFTISGFSYGAIKAFQYTLECVKNGKRVDRLQLFSPAYFNDETIKFKRLQLMFFKKDEVSYKNNFIKNTIYPNNIDISQYIINGTYDELNELLNYEWKEDELDLILTSGIKLEIFIGSKDKIVNSENSKKLFRKYGDVYFIKGVGHSLN